MLVVGAGPAGGRLARHLAAAGVRVMLVDRLDDLARAAFSSAAVPQSAVEGLALPEEVIAARWRAWHLVGPAGRARVWRSSRPLGAVLDFAALRRWQADEAAALGARVVLGWRAVASSHCGGRMRTWLRHGRGGRLVSVASRWVIDASGEARALLGDPDRRRAPLVVGLGVEWLLQVGMAQWQPWAERLSFFLGSSWVRRGYGWVFPMAPGLLKVGICRLEPELPSGCEPLQAELMGLLARLDLAQAPVLDRHGGRIRSSIRRREDHGLGHLLGLGDAVSTANLLGGEGIRHAITSADVLAPLLLEGTDPARLARRYAAQLRQALGWRWSLSGRLARRTWLSLVSGAADQRLERLLSALERRRAEDLSALLFDYRFERYGLRVLPYLAGG
nr:NAD(P)/FAD-dependent oxidoreductase [Cyanobium sp. NIES-981]